MLGQSALGLIVLLAIALGIVWVARSSRGASKREADIPRAVDVPSPPSFPLEQGEVMLGSVPATLESLHTDHEYVGGYSGISLRVARGVYLRGGGTRGHSVPHTSYQPDDSGIAYVTTRRLVFVGRISSSEVTRGHLRGVTQYVDGVIVNRANGKALMLLTQNPQILARAVQMAISSGPQLEQGLTTMVSSADKLTPLTVSLHLSLKGPPEEVAACLGELRDAIAAVLSAHKADLLSASAATPPPSAAPVSSHQALTYCLTTISSAGKAVSALGSLAPPAASEAAKIVGDAVDAMLNSLSQLERSMLSVSMPVAFADVQRDFSQSIDDLVNQCHAWLTTIDTQRDVAAKGDTPDLHLGLTYDLPLLGHAVATAGFASVSNPSS